MRGDSHASGFIGKTGRGTHEHCGVVGKIDIIGTTLGKALGGASGGCVSGRKELVEMCRQKARPYLFSNTVAPVIVSGAIKVIDLISKTTERRDTLEWNAKYWRQLPTEAGFDLKAGDSQIVPEMPDPEAAAGLCCVGGSCRAGGRARDSAPATYRCDSTRRLIPPFARHHRHLRPLATNLAEVFGLSVGA